VRSSGGGNERCLECMQGRGRGRGRGRGGGQQVHRADLHGELEGLGRPRHALGGRLEGDAARGCSAFSVSGSSEWVQGS
jgi:hypothetical protein